PLPASPAVAPQPVAHAAPPPPPPPPAEHAAPASAPQPAHAAPPQAQPAAHAAPPPQQPPAAPPHAAAVAQRPPPAAPTNGAAAPDPRTSPRRSVRRLDLDTGSREERRRGGADPADRTRGRSPTGHGSALQERPFQRPEPAVLRGVRYLVRAADPDKTRGSAT